MDLDFRLDYRALSESAPAGYFITLTDGTVVNANGTAQRWIGKTLDEVRGTSLLKLLPVGDRIVYTTHAMPQLELNEEFAELAVDLLGPEGQRIPVLLSATRSPASDGRPALDQVVAFYAHERRLYERDLISALRTAEDAEAARAEAEASLTAQAAVLQEKDVVLQASLMESLRKESMLETILNTIRVGVAVIDEDGRRILTNSRQRLHERLAAPSFTHRPTEAEMQIFGPDRITPIPVDQRPVQRAASGQSFSDQLVWYGNGEEQKALSVSARSVKGDDDAFRGSVIAYSDVTGLVNAVAAKDDFVANVSHELRTPLTSIMGYLELALDEEDAIPSHVASSLKVAQRNSEKLLHLVSDLLTAAAGSANIQQEVTDLSELVRAGITSAAPRAEINSVDIVAKVPETLPAMVDPKRISQVLDNLLSNAVKYSPDGGQVTVSAWRTDAGSTVLQVADSGIGMTEAEQAEVFTKFFRSGTARRAQIPGVGLGLVITKRIVEEHGGTIAMASEAGKGTVFTVTLP
ncbi:MULTISPECIES: PAS domain-containing sensor histidine kinase [unclassified Arthrobacter]|uniref:PAS domain-containing sensor histidine kinase n=1 Tax=unclassified Arthrobacter TaxID=235627 RepID=UPI001E646487|nr:MULTISPECIES: PAS domain-containing sensor histidine kinase [unclassified Arthrobacter]MCC9144568.1 PAS domain-containing sensor histidine kinase [Arthrobacter sp. zg-Y919]MDK1275794.1 PAS domain-containing sensor histidine kinase [Arthrobacter sp. zg.Y919]MDM7991425.1 PAS domain-containing sensor histidine kinase [Arthrobacter sp. zg-Y877]WIB02842.1 PAS domain-containing sensor histidine kinase [Arthrobacter sp. zg-Y919]